MGDTAVDKCTPSCLKSKTDGLLGVAWRLSDRVC